ncbi:MAG: alpha/beta fold hydrolase [bacterium]
MKRVLIHILFVLLGVFLGLFFNYLYNKPQTDGKGTVIQIKPRPLDKYSIESLSTLNVPPAKIEIGDTLKNDGDFTSSLFSFVFDPTLSGKEIKKVTGLINTPSGKGPFPVVVMLRGYVDQKLYKTGDGSKRAGEYFAKNGFITIAPDFLGYAGSDKESENIFESRFQTYTTTLTLLKSLKSIEGWDGQNIFIWGHSNGGQIALTILEATGESYPTVLWAPVSKPFPYSILYYTDESDDGGKLIRRELAEFEEQYDTDLYSITKYFDRIKASIQLHQGTGDDAVSKDWSDALIETLKGQGLTPSYYVYPGANHYLQPSWNSVVARDLQFFKKNFIIN